MKYITLIFLLLLQDIPHHILEYNKIDDDLKFLLSRKKYLSINKKINFYSFLSSFWFSVIEGTMFV